MARLSRLLGLTVTLLSLLLAGAGVSAANADNSPGQDAYVKAVLQYTNQYRAANGLPPLVWNPTIAGMSQSWAGTINSRINDGSYDLNTIHRQDGGVTLLPANPDWYGEIISINYDAKAVVDWWMSSPPHRAALLNPQATDVGIGYVPITKAGWSGLNVVVENLAGYPATRATLPPVPPVKAGDIAVVDPYGNLFAYP
ncbi:MAG TPA: CAP domain-containing protein, partial [Micrococcaceae bacterium]|nr:CAP domain-containing protein [Micrococcaceae bacterium]